MPNEIVHIRRFEGVIGITEERDLPDGAAVDAKNLDLLAPGAFVPMPDDASVGAILDGILFGVFDDGDTFVWHNGSNIRSATGLGGTIGSLTNEEAVGYTNSYSIASSGENVRMGLGNASAAAQPTQSPRFIGDIFHAQFGGSVPSGVQVEIATLVANCAGVTVDDDADQSRVLPTDLDPTNGDYDNGEVVLFLGHSYNYYVSLLYDGVQESSPMFLRTISVSKSAGEVGAGNGSLGSASRDFNITPAAGYKSAAFSFRLRTFSAASDQLPIRVSAVRMYRQDHTGSAITDDTIVGDLQFIAEIDVTVATGWTLKDVGNSDSDEYSEADDDFQKYTFTDDKPFYPETYENKTGIPPFVLEEELRYGLSTVAEGYHIVGRCWHSRYKDITTWIFRSRRWLFDMFDWTLDFLELPTEIEAIVTFAGRVYCFGEGVTYVVNPNSFDHEDTWEGIGCTDPRSIAISDAGMFWGDQNNIYFHDGTRLRSIGEAVLRNQKRSTAAWLNRTLTTAPIAFYDSRWNAFVMCYANNSSWYGYMYHLPTSRWSPLTFAGTLTGSLYRKQGKPIIAKSAANAVDAFDSATKRTAWDVTLHALRTIGLKAVYKHAYVEWKAGEPTFQYYEDDQSYSTPIAWGSPASAGSNIKKGIINSAPWAKVRTFAITISGDEADDCSNVSLIRRMMTPR